jgi:hypothetical protein
VGFIGPWRFDSSQPEIQELITVVRAMAQIASNRFASTISVTRPTPIATPAIRDPASLSAAWSISELAPDRTSGSKCPAGHTRKARR